MKNHTPYAISHKQKYTPVIGLEVHVELNTKSKMFCGCKNDWFGEKPNTYTCPVCLGLPGALPYPNKTAIESCIKIGMALNCDIPLLSKFDRKNYFYPDLVKGYQISQYDQPFAENGWVDIKSEIRNPKSETNSKSEIQNPKRIRIRRVHMEEDTGKLLHETVNGEKVSLIDFNRSGVPLVEIVTEPDFTSAAEVKEYLQKLQQIVRYLGVARADMDKGEMRLEPNISLRKCNTTNKQISNRDLPNYKVEVKNINSFSFVEKAIAYEIERQEKLLEKGETPKQETRGWDEDKKMTISQRSKEEAADYRYFPEPDIPPFQWTENFIRQLADQIAELPDAKLKRFQEEYKLSEYNAEILTRDRETADFFEEAVKKNQELRIKNQEATDEKTIANWIINKKINVSEAVPAEILLAIIKENQIEGIDPQELENILQEILAKNPKAVEDYKSGKTNVVMFLVGQAMSKLKGKAKADEIKQKIVSMISTDNI